MKYDHRFIAAAILLVLAICTGCESSSTAQSGDFVPGAFPPTLSDTDYHNRSWSRTDCLVCHDTGVQDAPLIKHVSVPELAKAAKCRTCHVLVPDSEPSR